MRGWFDLGRSEGYPTHYKDQHTAAPIDVPTAGLIISFAILAISLFAILPAYGKQKRRPLLLRIVVSLFTGGVVLVCNYGHNWETGVVKVITPYKGSSHEEIIGTIGLHITLRGVNITLKGTPLKHNNETSELENERIDYNENFSWEWAQGRFGFGKHAGRFSQEFRAASVRGVPLPILQVAEYFTFDGEGIRFGRYYRLAGWYTHLMMWAAFGTWFISNILFCMIVSSAIYFLIATGILQLCAIGIWTLLRNPIEIQIPFQSAEQPIKDILLKTYFGLDYYLVLGNGVFCIVLGFILLILNCFYPEELCTFFGIDPLTIYDELLLSKDEIETAKNMENDGEGNLLELGPVSMVPEITESSGSARKIVSFFGEEERPVSAESEASLVLKRRRNVASGLFQKSFRKPKPKPRTGGGSKFSGLLSPDVAAEGSQIPLLAQERRHEYGSSDEESHFRWPPPPRENAPPPPPPKKPAVYVPAGYVNVPGQDDY